MVAHSRWAAGLLLLCAAGCSGGGTPTQPSSGRPTIPSGGPAVPLPGSEVLTGRVSDRVTSAPIPGATVTFSQPHPSPHVTSDAAGAYSLTGLPAPGSGAFVFANAEGYEEDVRGYRATSQDFRLYPREQIAVGGSKTVTVRPDDSLCWNNSLEPGYGTDTVCRLVRIAPAAGELVVEAVPIGGGSRPTLVVAVHAGNRLLVERLANPASVDMTGGTTVIAFVAMPAGAPAQSFTVTASIAAR